MNVSRWFGLTMVALAACGAEPVRKVDDKPGELARGENKPVAPEGEPAHGQGKPTAPATLQLDSKDLGGRRFQVTLTATLSDNVDDVELSFVLPPGATIEEGSTSQRFGAGIRGNQRTLVRHVVLAEDGGDIVGAVRTRASGVNRNKPIRKRLGTPAPAEAPKPTTTITLPDGTQVQEVR
jgi:hypothetical protein